MASKPKGNPPARRSAIPDWLKRSLEKQAHLDPEELLASGVGLVLIDIEDMKTIARNAAIQRRREEEEAEMWMASLLPATPEILDRCLQAIARQSPDGRIDRPTVRRDGPHWCFLAGYQASQAALEKQLTTAEHTALRRARGSGRKLRV
jgi:hypothetical protein